jgi:hypothetical protein
MVDLSSSSFSLTGMETALSSVASRVKPGGAFCQR